MATALSHDAKEQVKRAIDIADLVGAYIALRREGRNFKGLCPWHKDSRPSLQVNPERQSWKCWVCDIGGDVFSFVERIEGVDFKDALKLLAERAGISLPSYHAGSRGGAEDVDEKKLLYQALAWAEQEFHDCLLKSPEAEPARRYLTDRGFSGDSVARFHLGFNPDHWDWLLKRALKTPFRPALLEKAGLVGQRRSGQGHYDFFKGRLVFSIRDAQRRPVGFGGRALPGIASPDAAKYKNTPETPLFTKSNLLYGLDVAKDTIGKTSTAIVMEGYADCLMAHQFGFTNAVAVLGTAVGERHIQLLKRFADRIVLMLDGDDAGQRRTNEVLGLFVAEQVDLQILTLPDKLDPCDFLTRHGADAFREQLGRTTDALEHKFRVATQRLTGGSGIHELQQAAEEVLATLAQAPRLQIGAASAQVLKEDQILNRLAHRSGVAETTLRKRLQELRRGVKPRGGSPAAQQAPSAAMAPLPKLERALLELLLQLPDCAALVSAQIAPEQLHSPRARIIITKCWELSEVGVAPTFDRLMLEFDDHALKSLLVELDEQGRVKSAANPRQDLDEVLARFRNEQLLRQSRAHQAVLEQRSGDEQQELQLWTSIIEQQRNRQGLSLPTDG